MHQIYHTNFKLFSAASSGIYSCLFKNQMTTARCITNKFRPRRAMLYVPGHDRRKIEKLQKLNIDCAVLDCEDGVAENKKTEARDVIREVIHSFDFGKTECAVRINSFQSNLAKEDIRTLFSAEKVPETIMVPKVESLQHIEWIHSELKNNLKTKQNKINLVFFVESATALLDLRAMCKKAIEFSKEGPFTLEGLVFGSDDFCADIGAARTENAMELLTARQMFVLIAKSFRLQAIDMVHINYKDLEGLLKMSREGANMGFTGKQVIHPDQIPIVQQAFSPSEEKVKWATELIEHFKEHQKQGKGAFTFHGAMIDKPLLLQAENIVKSAKHYN